MKGGEEIVVDCPLYKILGSETRARNKVAAWKHGPVRLRILIRLFSYH